jgi:DNA-3-methyladenine glycosylase I
MKKRCLWAESHELMTEYHDYEWGRPAHDDRQHFEFLILEAAQAGLSWITVLKRRDGYRRAFANFDPQKVAKFPKTKIEKLMQDASIIRNRLKIESVLHNAKLFLQIQKEFGTFDKYIWNFVGGKPKVNRWRYSKQIPSTSKESDALSNDMKKRGFKFVGSTVLYAHMQAVGMINDHLVSCFCYKKMRFEQPQVKTKKLK